MIPHRKIAEDILYRWEYKYSMEDEELAKEKAHNDAESWTIEELESHVNAKKPTSDTVEGILSYLETHNVGLTPEEAELYKKAIEEGPEDAPIFSIVKEKILGLDDQNELILYAISSKHDEWVKEYENKFFSREKKHKHMPLELIGWTEAKKDLAFIKPILNASNIEIDEEKLKEAYNQKATDYLNNHNIKSNDDLAKLVSNGVEFYSALDGQSKILKSLSDAGFVATTLIPQIETNGIGSIDRVLNPKLSKFTPMDIENAVSKVATINGMNEESRNFAELLTPNDNNTNL